jgi:hypothetical protein
LGETSCGLIALAIRYAQPQTTLDRADLEPKTRHDLKLKVPGAKTFADRFVTMSIIKDTQSRTAELIVARVHG